jgi:hypothetical protein
LRDQSGGQIAIAYTVWSKKKGGGKLIVKEVFKKIKKSNHLNRLITLSPLTEMATKFHSNNGAKLIQINETTQNFEYKGHVIHVPEKVINSNILCFIYFTVFCRYG